MLSPVDIQNKEFKKAKLGGYNVEEVNDFLEEVLQAYQQLTKENFEIKDKISMLNENIQHYRNMEASIQNALVIAEKTAQETKSLAHEKASQIKKDAEQKSEAMLEEARQELYTLSHKIDDLKQQYIGYRVQIKQVLQTQLEILEQQNIIESEVAASKAKPLKIEATEQEERQEPIVKEVTELPEEKEQAEEIFYTKEFKIVAEDTIAE